MMTPSISMEEFMSKRHSLYVPLMRVLCLLLGVQMLFGLGPACTVTGQTDAPETERVISTEPATGQDTGSVDAAAPDTRPPTPDMRPEPPPIPDQMPPQEPPPTPDKGLEPPAPDRALPEPPPAPDQMPPDQATPEKTPCQHDCDCDKLGLVCDSTSKVCAALRRPSNCVACTQGVCQPGDPCKQSDGTIDTCPQNGACKSDCDCVIQGLNCDAGKCSPSRRLNLCPQCSGSNCPKGDPCVDNGKLGTCGATTTSCQSDCDCIKIGQNCEQGTCAPTKRVNQCPSCSDKSCQSNTVCKQADGTLARCCCTIAGCNTGSKCCVSSGVAPPPGFCSFSCFTGSQCPPPPP